jgi:DNA-directed RNA polymerase subunit M/transcription elongation factor TFIIS
MQSVIGRPGIPYSMAPKPKKASKSTDEDGEELVSCDKCGGTEYVAVVKQSASGKQYSVKCKKCGKDFSE